MKRLGKAQRQSIAAAEAAGLVGKRKRKPKIVKAGRGAGARRRARLPVVAHQLPAVTKENEWQADEWRRDRTYTDPEAGAGSVRDFASGGFETNRRRH